MTVCHPPPASSAMQKAFGADVEMAVADIGLYLVAAHDEAGPAMRKALAAADASVAARISPTRVLAVMRYSSFETLRVSRAIALIGPVHLDAERFAVFQRLAGMELDGA